MPDYDDEPDFGSYGDQEQTAELGANAFEQLELTREARRLETAKRRRYESQKPCLDAAKALAEIKLKTATERRLTAEAELARAREHRLLAEHERELVRDRERAAAAEARTEEVKAQAAHEVRQLAEETRGYAAAAQSEWERRMWVETGERLDPDTAEFLTCPECSVRMGIDERGDGLICPECNTRKERGVPF